MARLTGSSNRDVKMHKHKKIQFVMNDVFIFNLKIHYVIIKIIRDVKYIICKNFEIMKENTKTYK